MATEKYSHYLTLAFIIGYNLIFGLIIFWKYRHFGYDAMDLAIINNVFYNSSLGHFFALSIHPPTYLGDHFSPILFIILPFYYLARQPLTLAFLQTLTMSLAAWPIYLITKNILNRQWAWIFALAWLINPFVQNITLFEFSFLPFAVLLIFWTFYFYQKNRFWPFILFCFLSLLVREDVALVIFVFGWLAWLDKKKVRWQIWPIIISVAYFILAIKINGHFAQAGSYKFLLYYSWLGNSFGDIIKNCLLQPWRLLPQIFSPGSLVVFMALLLPTAYLPLWRSRYLWLSGIIYLQLVLGTNWHWVGMILYTQYSSLLLPGIFIAWIFGTKKFLANTTLEKTRLKFLVQEKPLLKMIIITTVIYASLSFGPLLTGAGYIFSQGLKKNPIDLINDEAIKQIPRQAPVAATYQLMTPLSSRPNIYSLNYVFLGKQQFLIKDYALPADTQYLAIDYADFSTYVVQYYLNQTYQNDYLAGQKNWLNNLKNFGLIWIKDSVAIYQKGAENKFELVKTLPPNYNLANKNEKEIDADLKFLGYQLLDGQYHFFWQTNSPLKKNYQLKLILRKAGQPIYQKIYPWAYGQINFIDSNKPLVIQTNYWFIINKKIAQGEYDLSFQIMEITKGMIEVNPLRSTNEKIYTGQNLGPEISLGKINL